MQDKYKIDLSTGLVVDTVHPDCTGEDVVETTCNQSFYIPKWTGAEWVEGATQEYIDSLKTQAQPQALTMEQMAIALMQAQTELEDAQIALDFILLGGI